MLEHKSVICENNDDSLIQIVREVQKKSFEYKIEIQEIPYAISYYGNIVTFSSLEEKEEFINDVFYMQPKPNSPKSYVKKLV